MKTHPSARLRLSLTCGGSTQPRPSLILFFFSYHHPRPASLAIFSPLGFVRHAKQSNACPSISLACNGVCLLAITRRNRQEPKSNPLPIPILDTSLDCQHSLCSNVFPRKITRALRCDRSRITKSPKSSHVVVHPPSSQGCLTYQAEAASRGLRSKSPITDTSQNQSLNLAPFSTLCSYCLVLLCPPSLLDRLHLCLSLFAHQTHSSTPLDGQDIVV